MHLFGIAQPPDEIDIAGGAEQIRWHPGQGRQHLAIVDHAKADQAGQGEAGQGAGCQPFTDHRQARLAPLRLRRRQARETAQAQRCDQQT
ncbi:hypothetical protein D3C86_1743820 [compost metagenome]